MWLVLLHLDLAPQPFQLARQLVGRQCHHPARVNAKKLAALASLLDAAGCSIPPKKPQTRVP
jgi:hypothetical protein